MRKLFINAEYMLGDSRFTVKAHSETFVVLQHGDTESVMSRDEFEAVAVLSLRFDLPVLAGNFRNDGVLHSAWLLGGCSTLARGSWYIDLREVPRELLHMDGV